MENYNNEIFGFGTNEDGEQTNNFNYDSISGLGESNYENEDLFNTEVDYNQDVNNDYRIGSFDSSNTSIDSNYNNFENYSENYVENIVPNLDTSAMNSVDTEKQMNNNLNTETNLSSDAIFYTQPENTTDYVSLTESPNEENNIENIPTIEESSEPIYQEIEDDNNEEDSGTEKTIEYPNDTIDTASVQPDEITDIPSMETSEINEMEENPINFSDTPIEELNKLTEYEEQNIESTDINELFDKVSTNFKDASEIFRKNTDLKNKIDSRFEELKKLQSELENNRKNQIDEINKYKEEVLEKLTEKKEEIEKRLNLLKESQTNLEKEKQEFEQYKKKEQENIDKVQKEVQSAYDDRREELNHLEDVLRKQKDALDEERNQLSLDRISYESDKNELANNLLKFNELVNSFTNGVDDIRE